MHIEHSSEVRNFHFAKGPVAQDAGISTEQIDASPFFSRPRDHRGYLLEIRDIGAVRHRHATRGADFLDHAFGRSERAAATVAGTAEVVDDDLCAAARQTQRVRASKTIARAGHDSDASVKPDCHDCSSQSSSEIDQADPVGHKRGLFLTLDFHGHAGA